MIVHESLHNSNSIRSTTLDILQSFEQVEGVNDFFKGLTEEEKNAVAVDVGKIVEEIVVADSVVKVDKAFPNIDLYQPSDWEDIINEYADVLTEEQQTLS